jgi:hypothetical protein
MRKRDLIDMGEARNETFPASDMEFQQFRHFGYSAGTMFIVRSGLVRLIRANA